MNLQNKIARMIIGPYKPVPKTCKFSLDHLRGIRWSNATKGEQLIAMWAAKTIIRELELKEPK